MEEWKEITDYPNYEISNLGNVRNKTTNNLLKKEITRDYYHIQLWKKGKRKHFRIHRLIAEAFIPNPNSLLEIDHIDRNRKNNSLDNLRWVSSSQNGYNRNMKTQNSTSKYRGVCWVKSKNKWKVQIKINGKPKYIGIFEREEEGAKAFNEFVISHNLAEFVELNIIE